MEKNKQILDINKNIELIGFFNAENWGRWSNGKECSIRFFNYNAKTVQFDVQAFLHKKHPSLDVDVFVNGKKQRNWLFEQGKTLPYTVLKIKPFRKNIITFKVKNPIVPKDIIDSTDDRLLGIGIKKMILKN